MDLGANFDEMPFALHVGLSSHYYVKGSKYPKNGTPDIIKSYASTVV